MDRSRMDQANARMAKLTRAKSKLSEYETEQEAVRAKTERLRALRLARDAAEQVTAAPAPKRKAPKQKKQSVGLSEWLAEQQKTGRRS